MVSEITWKKVFRNSKKQMQEALGGSQKLKVESAEIINKTEMQILSKLLVYETFFSVTMHLANLHDLTWHLELVVETSYSSNKIRKAQIEHLIIICQN